MFMVTWQNQINQMAAQGPLFTQQGAQARGAQ
jgi:hypothetical protein